MTTALDLINEARRHVLGGFREPMNRLNGAIATTGATTCTLKYDKPQVGQVFSIDLERVRVWEVSGQAASVIERAVDGTTAATHADLAVVRVNSAFDDFAFLQAVNDDLDDLSSPSNGLFKTAFVDLTYNAQFQGYDLAGVVAIIGEPLKLLAKTSSTDRYWPEINRWRYDTNLPTVEFSSGKAVFLYEAGHQGQTIRVFYRAPFTNLAAYADDVATVAGLPATAHDIPALGAAARIAAFREVRRNRVEEQGDSRRAQEVPPGAVTASSAALFKIRAQRISAEAGRLAAEWPTRMRSVG